MLERLEGYLKEGYPKAGKSKQRQAVVRMHEAGTEWLNYIVAPPFYYYALTLLTYIIQHSLLILIHH